MTTYEVMIDNARMDVHCHDEAPENPCDTVRLHTGSAFTHPGASAGIMIVGSGPVWDDGSDSSYVDLKINTTPATYIATTTLDTLTVPDGTTVTEVTVNLRASSVSGSPCRLDVVIHDQSYAGGSFDVPAVAPVDGGPGGFGGNNEGWFLSGGPLSLTHAFDDEDFDYWGSSLSGLVGLLESGAGISARILGNLGDPSMVAARVFEIQVDVTYCTLG